MRVPDSRQADPLPEARSKATGALPQWLQLHASRHAAVYTRPSRSPDPFSRRIELRFLKIVKSFTISIARAVRLVVPDLVQKGDQLLAFRRGQPLRQAIFVERNPFADSSQFLTARVR